MEAVIPDKGAKDIDHGTESLVRVTPRHHDKVTDSTDTHTCQLGPPIDISSLDSTRYQHAPQITFARDGEATVVGPGKQRLPRAVVVGK